MKTCRLQSCVTRSTRHLIGAPWNTSWIVQRDTRNFFNPSATYLKKYVEMTWNQGWLQFVMLISSWISSWTLNSTRGHCPLFWFSPAIPKIDLLHLGPTTVPQFFLRQFLRLMKCWNIKKSLGFAAVVVQAMNTELFHKGIFGKKKKKKKQERERSSFEYLV